ncbi:MAG TPA: TetR/AcrR family transcriptional regulator [Solimonas sp.]|nr:TetR/AcrR family transcriptional regulator [Solimonas sp.]
MLQPIEVKKRRKHAPDETRAQLLRASAKCFAAVGYGRTQVSDVTREAGVAVGTFYVHFTDKEEALLTVLKSHFDPARAGLESLRTQLKADGADLARSLREVQKFLIQHSLQDRDGFLAWYRHGHDVSENADRLVGAYSRQLEQVFTEELAESGLDNKTRPLLAQAVVSLILGLVDRRLVHGDPKEEDALRISLLVAMGGVMAGRADQAASSSEINRLMQSARALAA